MGKIAQVTGVLHYNDETREEMLKRIYWKDTQYTRFGGDFVKYANITNRNPESLDDGKGLLDYTFNKNTDYGKKINRDYLGNGIDAKEYFVEESVPNGERWKWSGDYRDSFVPESKLWRYAEGSQVAHGAINIYANDDRYLAQKYITPKLVNFYGSSPGLNTKLIKYTFGQYYTGRISDIEEADVKFEHDYLDYLNSGDVKISEDNLWEVEAPRRHMYGMLIDAAKLTGKDYFSNEERYVTFLQTINNGTTKERGIIANEREFTDDGFKIYEYRNRYWQNYAHETNFSEGDINYNGPAEMLHEEGADTSFREPAFKAKSLLSKTNDLFKAHKISTLAARFHTSGEISDEPEITDTAKSRGYGNSHGRNLLKKNPMFNSNTNGYDNPYCRVWTYHHQYDRVSKLIRPFNSEEGEVHDNDPYIANYGENVDDGRKYLKMNTVLGKNGFLNIAPKGDACGNLTTEIKNCMFSIENLAWKDVPRNMGYISKEQRGPNGGRIMWFPPYDLDFNEMVQVDWNRSNFIGRGEPVFTYNNTSRQGTLSFAILIDHPSIIDNIPKYNISPTDDGNDIEADVLRFFAGCQIPNLKKKDGDCADTPKEINSEQKPGDEPKLDSPKEEKAKHIKFCVYFPNNYSGNSVKISQSDWAQGGSSDRDWFDYLMLGNNVNILDTGQGYERLNVGVSSNPQEENNSYPVNEKTATWESGSGTVKDVRYKYRVDFDLHQKLHNVFPDKKTSRDMVLDTNVPSDSSNYVDSCSFELNSSLNNNPYNATHTFLQIIASMYAAFPDNFNGTKVPSYIGNFKDDELVTAFKEGKFKTAEMKAGATSQDSKNSKTLAERRCRSVMDFLIDYGKIEKNIFGEPSLLYNNSLTDPTTINILEAKKQKFASVELWYDAPESQKLSQTAHPTYDNVIEDNGEEIHYGDHIETSAVVASKTISVATENDRINGRYETEAEYFKNIEKEDPIVYKSIVSKFKYFSPAYHAISPEGFNARLTFLQQCTRQGHTISATDLNYVKTAGNLSFGRMPVCVLKIGDFINTKIIINSMSINYGANGTPQWDLNPEGIGVQPMYAKVQLGIVILGGQSLNGPINRLQNAVSFNYYANTGVYDNRADRIGIETEPATGGKVREETVETSGDKVHLTISDDSNYGITKTTYQHIWNPYPNVVVKDDYNKELGTYNEYKARGIRKNSDGTYELGEEK